MFISLIGHKKIAKEILIYSIKMHIKTEENYKWLRWRSSIWWLFDVFAPIRGSEAINTNAFIPLFPNCDLSPPSSWQFPSISREQSGVSGAMRCEWRTCGTKSVTLRRRWTRIGVNRRCSGLWPLAGAKRLQQQGRVYHFLKDCLSVIASACLRVCVCVGGDRHSFFCPL